MSNEELAVKLDNFSYEFDLYGYRDAIDDREQAVAIIITDLEQGNVSSYIEWLNEIISECYSSAERYKAKSLRANLRAITT